MKLSNKPKVVAKRRSRVIMPNQNAPRPVTPYEEREKYPANYKHPKFGG